MTFDKQSEEVGKVIIKMVEADYRKEVDQEIKKAAKNANVKGFRPGKVPFSYIKRLYESDLLARKVYDISFSEYDKYIKENNIHTYQSPTLNDEESKLRFDTQRDFEIVFDIGLIDFDKINIEQPVTLTSYDVKLKPAFIDEKIEGFQESLGDYEETSEIDAGGQIKCKITFEDKIFHPDYFDFDFLGKKNIKLLLKKKVGDVLKLNTSNATEKENLSVCIYGEKDKYVPDTVFFEIMGIRHRNKHELNEEFYKKLFPGESINNLEEFKQKVENHLVSEYNKQAEILSKKQMRLDYIKKIGLKLSEDYLRKRLSANSAQNKQNYSEEEIKNYFLETKWNIIINKILDVKGIEIGEEDIINYGIKMIKDQLRIQSQNNAEDEEIKQYVISRLNGEGGEEFQTQVIMGIRNNIALDYLVSLSKEKKETISFKELKKLQLKAEE